MFPHDHYLELLMLCVLMQKANDFKSNILFSCNKSKLIMQFEPNNA